MIERKAGPWGPRYRLGHRLLLPTVGFVLVAGAFVFGLASGPASGKKRNWPATKLIDVPALVAPPATPAPSAGLHPEALVIGVAVEDEYRAYVIEAMSKSASHVVNDVIAGTPLTVAYCDRTKCVRAYTGDGGEPLDLAVGGWFNADEVTGMLVRVGSDLYHLKSGRPLNEESPPFPYEGTEVEVSTWGEWRTAHPNTDVYLGGRRHVERR